MTEKRERRGGWPGPAKPKWTFRPTDDAQAVIAAYLDRHGLRVEVPGDRSRAINALLATHPDAQGGHMSDLVVAEDPYACRTCGNQIEGISAPAGPPLTRESASRPITLAIQSAIPCGHTVPSDQAAAMNATSPTP